MNSSRALLDGEGRSAVVLPKEALKMTQMQRIPTAAVVLCRGKHSWAWVVPACPYCGKLHEHFGGALDSDPQRYLGRPVTARCDLLDRQQQAAHPLSAVRVYVLEAEARGCA